MSLLYKPIFYTAEHYLRFKNPTEEHYRVFDFFKSAATPTIAMTSSAALGALISQQIIARTGITVGMFFLGAAAPVAVATAIVGIAYAAGAKEAIINCFFRVAGTVTRSLLHGAIDSHRLPNIVKMLAGEEMATLVSNLQTHASAKIKTLINNIVTADNLKKLYTDRKTAVIQILKANEVAGSLQGVLGKALSAEVKASLLGVLPQFMVDETAQKIKDKDGYTLKDADGNKILETAEQTAARVANEKTMLALVESLIQNSNAEIAALIPHLVTQTNITKYDTYSKAKSEASKASKALRKANKALKNMKPEDAAEQEAGLQAAIDAAKAQVEAKKPLLQNALNELIAELPGIAANPDFMNALNGVVGKVLGDPVKESLLTILPQFMVTETPIKVKDADGRKVLETPAQTAARVANEKAMLALVQSVLTNGNAEIAALLPKLLTVENINKLPDLKVKADAFTNAAPEAKAEALNELIAELPGIAANPDFMNALNGVVGKVLGDPVKESLLTILPQFMVTETPIKVKDADGRKVLETPAQTAARVANEKTMLALVESLIQNGNAEIATLLSKLLTIDNINNVPALKTKYDAYSKATADLKADKDNAEKKAALQTAQDELFNLLQGIISKKELIDSVNAIISKIFKNSNEQPAFKENFDKFLRSFLQTRPDTHKFAYADKAFADLIIKALEDMEFQIQVPELLSTILDPMVLPQIMELLPEAMAYLKAESPVDEVKALPPLLKKVGPLLSIIEHNDDLKQKLFGFIFALIPPLKDNPEELIEYIRSSLILSEPQIKEIERLKAALAADAPERDAVRVNRDLHSSGLRRLLQTYHDAHEHGKLAQALQAAKVKVLGELATEKVAEDTKKSLREAIEATEKIKLSKDSKPTKTLKLAISEYNELQAIQRERYIVLRKTKLQKYINETLEVQIKNVRIADALDKALQNNDWRDKVLSGIKNVLTGSQGSVGAIASIYADYAQHNVDKPKENLPEEVKKGFNALVLQKPELMQPLRAAFLATLGGAKPIAIAYTEGNQPHIAHILLAKDNPSYNNFFHAFQTELDVNVLKYLLEEYVKSGDLVEVLRTAMKDQDKGPKVKRFVDNLCQNQGREVADPVWLFQVLVSPLIPIETARDSLLNLGTNNVDHTLDVLLNKADAEAEPDFKINEPEPAPNTLTKMGNIATGLYGIAKRAASAPLQTAYASTNIGLGIVTGAARGALQAVGDKVYGNKTHETFLKLAGKKSAQYVARIYNDHDQNIPENTLVLDIKNCTISDALNIPQGLNLGVLKISNTTINIVKLMTLLSSKPAIVEFSEVKLQGLALDNLTEQMAVELSKYLENLIIDEEVKTKISSIAKWHGLNQGATLLDVNKNDLLYFVGKLQNNDESMKLSLFGDAFHEYNKTLYNEIYNMSSWSGTIAADILRDIIQEHLNPSSTSSRSSTADSDYGTPAGSREFD